jgi:AcrR family transcriptional regulator
MWITANEGLPMERGTRRKTTAANGKRTSQAARLDAAAWIDCALQVLTERGIDGVRVEVLAKQLGVTKGSFYWHFTDRSALLAEMLQTWRKRETLGIIERLESTHEPAMTRLSRLLRVQFDAKKAAAEIELSIRLWARRDTQAAQAFQEVDELRLRYIAKLLDELGTDKDAIEARAVLIYCYMQVSGSLAGPVRDKRLTQACERILMGAGD